MQPTAQWLLDQTSAKEFDSRSMMHRGKRGYAGHNSKATLAAAASVFGLLLVIGVSLRSNAGVAFIAEEEEEEGANGVCSVVGAARKSREEEELFSGPLKRWRGREGVSASEIAFCTSQGGIKFYYQCTEGRFFQTCLVYSSLALFPSFSRNVRQFHHLRGRKKVQ